MVTGAHTVIENPNATAENKDASAFGYGTKSQLQAKGASGTEVFAGYFSEEYLSTLRGTRGAEIWDEMYRSESQVAMLMNAIMNPIKAATWEIDPHEATEEYEKHAALIRACLFDAIDFDAFKHEALTLLRSGFSLFEVVHNVVYNHPQFGTFNGIASLGFRSQKTIESWKIERKTGKLLAVEQYSQGDIAEKTSVLIPGEFVLVFSNLKEGDNYEGISVLRPMYGPFVRKNLYLKLAAIGIEKYAIGTPIGTIPAGKEKTPEFAEFKKVLAAYTSHQASYITTVEGWKIDIQKGEFDAGKIKEMILLENTEMINCVVANFLALGTNGGGGAYALGSDLSDFFLSGIQSYANLICGVVNRQLIPNLIKMNFGQQAGYPKMKCTGINDKAGSELAEVLAKLKQSGAVDTDAPLKDYVRKAYKFPKAATEITATSTPVEAPAQTPEERVQLDEKYRRDFDKSKKEIKALMQEHLREMLNGLRDKLRKKYLASAPADRVKTAIGIEAPGVTAYRLAMREALAAIAASALDGARREVPRKLKLTETLDSIRLAGVSYFDKLPPRIKKIVEAQAALITGTTAADLEKVTFFQFTSSATGTEDIESILHEVNAAARAVVDGSTATGMSVDAAAANAVAAIQNQTRLEFFFEPEVLEEIESFTFNNEDPISEICKELNGQTFAVTDPELDKYSPPLHHNCKSRLTPNLRGSKGNPKVDSGVAVTAKALKSITLCEGVTPYRIC